MRAVLDGAPQPQPVFDREGGERDVFDQRERRRVTFLILGHRFERDRDQVDHDERDQQPVDGGAEPVADRALLEHLVDAPAKCPNHVACHAVATLLETQRY